MSIRNKLILSGAGSGVIVILVLIFAATQAANSYHATVLSIVDDQARQELEVIARDTEILVESQAEAVALKVNNDLNVARELGVRAGGFSLDTEHTWAWDAVNQFTKEATSLDIPQMTIGGAPIVQTASFSDPLPVVDETYDLVGGTTTIFQRMNAEGDMLRVATTVRTLDDTRAVGTYIPAVNPDGTDNVVISTVLSGETYRGIAYVVNAWYVTAYEPIYDAAGEVVGILYQGEKQESLDILRQSIQSTEVGANGYVAVLGGTGTDAGQFIMSRNGEFDGEFVLETTDVDGNLFYADLIEQAVQLQPGDVLTVDATWQHPGDDRPEATMMNVTYFAPWDWVIVTNAYAADFAGPAEAAEAGVSRMSRGLLIIGLIAALVGWLIAWLRAKKIADPLESLTKAAERISVGDPDVDIDHSSQDEIGVLAEALAGLAASQRTVVAKFDALAQGDLRVELESRHETDQLAPAFNTSIQNLRAIVEHAQQVTGRISETTRIMQDASNETVQAASGLATQVGEVADRVAEQSTRSSEVVDTVQFIGNEVSSASGTTEEAASISAEANALAEEGTDKLRAAVESMRSALDTMSEVTDAVGALSNHSSQVEEAVEFIRNIANQTNLLALNAAIEAARAGESGRGFAVVASEVKALAEESAESTERISEIVSEMRSVTDRVVTAIDSGRQEVQQGNDVVNDAGQSFEAIGRSIETMAVRLEAARESSLAAAESIVSIVSSVETLREFAEANSETTLEVAAQSEQTAAAADEIGRMVAQLVEVGEGLESAVRRFQI